MLSPSALGYSRIVTVENPNCFVGMLCLLFAVASDDIIPTTFSDFERRNVLSLLSLEVYSSASSVESSSGSVVEVVDDARE